MSIYSQVSSLYVHFPYCKHLCNYCDFYKMKLEDENGPFSFSTFHSFLEKQEKQFIDLLQNYDYELTELKTLYFGGGTPSLWGEDGISWIKKFLIKNHIKWASSYEFTLEVNPRKNEFLKDIKKWQEAGANRFSFGVQALDDRFLKVLERTHTKDDVLDILNYMHKNQFNYSVDFMLGLPFSDDYKRDIIAELTEILSFSPPHMSLYILKTNRDYIWKDKLPNEDFVADEYTKVANYLTERGYQHYEVSNFSKKNFESQHNLNYWLQENMGALGPSATGFLKRNEKKAMRYKWQVNADEYVLEELGIGELSLEKIYLMLRTNRGVDLQDDFFSGKNLKDWQNLFKKWQKDHYVISPQEGVYFPTSRGFLFLDELMQDIFRYIPDFPSKN